MSQKEAYFYNFYGICIGTYLKCQIDVDHKRKNKRRKWLPKSKWQTLEVEVTF